MRWSPKAVLSVLREALRRFNAKGSWVLSSHIAMSMMLALFPFVLFTVALSGAITGLFSDAAMVDEVIDLVFGAWPQAVAAPIAAEVQAVLDNSGGGLMTFGGLLTLYFASNGVDAVRVALLRAYDLEETRPFWRHRLLSIGLVVAGGVGLLLAAFFEVLLPLLATFIASYFPETNFLRNWSHQVNALFIVAVPIAAVCLFHWLLLPRRVGLWNVLPGVVFTLVAWAGTATGFSIYVSGFASYSATYAGLAGAMAALMFLYLNAAMLILGAELNGALAVSKASETHTKG